MPLQKLQFRPGINRESTTLANEGGWFESEKIRFRSGSPEKIGGWVADVGTTPSALQPPTGSFWGIARSMWNWITLASFNLLSVGTNLKYYIQNGVGGYFYDITPIRFTTAAGEATFAATNGSTTLTVTDAGHGAQANDFVTYSGAVALSTQTYTADAATDKITFTTALLNGTTIQLFTTSAAPAGLSVGTVYYVVNSDTPAASCQLSLALGGAVVNITGAGSGTQTFALTTGITATILNAEFQIKTIISNNSYTITSSVAANASDSGNGGSATIAAYQITTGAEVNTASVGWGSGGWGGINPPSPVSSTLNGAIDAVVTTITLVSTAPFAASGTIIIDAEIITYAAKGGGNTLTGCARGQSGTLAASHLTGALVQDDSSFTGWGSPAPAGVGLGLQLRLWSESNYGQDLIFNPRGGGIYYWAVNANPNVFDRGTQITSTNAPTICNFVMVSDASRFVLTFGVNDYVGSPGELIQNPMLIRWSNQEDYTLWTPAITNQAGSYTLSHGSRIVSASQARQEILVWTDAAIYSMQYLGPPFVWGFQLLADNISIAGPNATATANNVTYWMGTDKFYMYSGRVETLPCSLRSFVFNDINMSQSDQFFASTNEGYNEVWWFYCSANSTVIDKYVVYNHLERIWYYGTMGRTAWLDSPLRTEPLATTYGNKLVYHETGVDDGTTNPPTPIVAYVQSSDFDVGDGHAFGFVDKIIPDVTFDGSTVAAPTLNFTVRPRQFPGTNYGASDSPPVISAVSYAGQRTYNVQQFTQQVYVRLRGRQMAFRVSSDTLGTQWQLGIPRINIRPDGRR